MKRLLCLAAMVFCLCTVCEACDCSAKAMILLEPRTGTVLQESHADEPMLVASTTKIMTALVVLEQAELSEELVITPEQAAVEGSSMYLRAGECYTVEELLCGMMLASGNDAAKALAEHISGSEEAFAELMNEKCAALGMENSHFVNPHGLDAEGHYSSARDLAILTAAAMECPEFCRIFSEESRVIHGVCYVNHNKLLQSLPDCIGGKTGYTKAAGRILVSAAERDGLRLICVTISDPNDWTDHTRLYEEAFETYRYLSLPGAGWESIPVLSGLFSATPVGCKVCGLLVKREAETEIQVELPRFLFAPVAAGETIGTVTVRADGEVIFSEALWSGTEIPADRGAAFTPWERIRRKWESIRCGNFGEHRYFV